MFAFSGEAKSKKYAVEIIHECHEAWRKLVSGEAAAKTDSYNLSMWVNARPSGKKADPQHQHQRQGVQGCCLDVGLCLHLAPG